MELLVCMRVACVLILDCVNSSDVGFSDNMSACCPDEINRYFLVAGEQLMGTVDQTAKKKCQISLEEVVFFTRNGFRF